MVGFFSNLGKTLTAALGISSQTFRIQLYWEDGYEWQEVDFEFEQFCMMHQYRGFPGYGACFYGTEAGLCRDDTVYIAKCNDDRRQQWNFIDLGNREFQIQADSTGACMERVNRKKIRLRECDDSIERQRWYTPGGKNDDAFFAISQGSSNLCMGQLHHPKNGEEVEMNNCRQSERMDTLYWERD